jgi:hypothetical protein
LPVDGGIKDLKKRLHNALGRNVSIFETEVSQDRVAELLSNCSQKVDILEEQVGEFVGLKRSGTFKALESCLFHVSGVLGRITKGTEEQIQLRDTLATRVKKSQEVLESKALSKTHSTDGENSDSDAHSSKSMDESDKTKEIPVINVIGPTPPTDKAVQITSAQPRLLRFSSLDDFK